MASRSTLHRQGYRRRCSPTRRFQANPDSWFLHVIGLNNKPKRADSQFRRQARRPSKWQREGQPNKYLQEDGGQRTDRPSASSSTAKRTLDGLSPPPPPKHRDLVRLPCLLTPPLPSLASVLSPVREEASRHPLSSPPFAPPPPSLSLSLSLLLTPPLLLFLLLPPPGRPIPTQAFLSGLWSISGLVAWNVEIWKFASGVGTTPGQSSL